MSSFAYQMFTQTHKHNPEHTEYSLCHKYTTNANSVYNLLPRRLAKHEEAWSEWCWRSQPCQPCYQVGFSQESYWVQSYKVLFAERWSGHMSIQGKSSYSGNTCRSKALQQSNIKIYNNNIKVHHAIVYKLNAAAVYIMLVGSKACSVQLTYWTVR